MNETSWKPYLDSRECLVQADGDGGDSANRMGILIFCLYALGLDRQQEKAFDTLVREYYCGFGLWRRHWNEEKWYSHFDNFSRDQFEKVWLATLVTPIGFYFTFTSLIRQLFRLGFHQNLHKGTDCTGFSCFKIPDLPGIGQFQNFLRAYLILITIFYFYGADQSWTGLFIPYGLLAFLDLRFFADLYFRKKQPWDYDALMLTDLMFASKRFPTITSILATKKYLKTDWQERILFNFSRTPNDIKPLGELYVFAAKKVFNVT